MAIYLENITDNINTVIKYVSYLNQQHDIGGVDRWPYIKLLMITIKSMLQCFYLYPITVTQ